MRELDELEAVGAGRVGAEMVAGGASCGKGPMAAPSRSQRQPSIARGAQKRALRRQEHIFARFVHDSTNRMHEMSLDRPIFKLLSLLQDDASLSNAELAERIGLSASQCSRRRAGLEEAGYIRAYRADLDARKLGYTIEVFTRVTLSSPQRQHGRGVRALPRRT